MSWKELYYTPAEKERNEKIQGGSKNLVLGKNIPVPMLVDKTSMTWMLMPVLLLIQLGISTDSAFDPLPKKVYGAKPSGNARKENSNYMLPEQVINDNKKIGSRKVYIQIPSPINYTTTHTKAKTNRVCRHIMIRVPIYVPLLSLGWWLYNIPDAKKRPLGFATERQQYAVIKLELKQMGEKSNKVEKPESEQITLTDVAGETPNLGRAPKG